MRTPCMDSTTILVEKELMEEWLKWLMETITISEMKRSVLRLNYCLTIWMILLCVKEANKILCAIGKILILVKE